MRILIDLDNDTLKKLEKDAEASGRSRKSHAEFIIKDRVNPEPKK